eukprot:6068441-Alexandrium_andersonii.AAC.1
MEASKSACGRLRWCPQPGAGAIGGPSPPCDCRGGSAKERGRLDWRCSNGASAWRASRGQTAANNEQGGG